MTGLPTAPPRAVRDWAVATARRHGGRFAVVLLCFGLATLIGLARPRLLGAVVDGVGSGAGRGHVDLLACLLLLAVAGQAAARGLAKARCRVFSETVLADTRERLVDDALALPLDVVETAGAGDLLSRATKDVSRVNQAVRVAVPEVLIAVTTVLLTTVAMLLTSPLLSLCLLVALPVLVAGNRWYQRRVPDAMITALGRWGRVQSTVHESVDGSRAVEALSLGGRRRDLADAALADALAAERGIRRLRVRWLATLDIGYLLPIAVALVLGGLAHERGWASLGEVAAVLAYLLAMITPLNEALWWLEELQVASAALRRVLGVSQARGAATVRDGSPPEGRDLVLSGVRFAYPGGKQVLHGIDLVVPPGQRLVLVGPSGAGKSTVGRLIAGIAAPTAGRVLIGGADVAAMPDDVRRGEVLLLTQENHVFAGTIRDNLTLPARRGGGEFSTEEITAALTAVGALAWVESTPDGLDTAVGSGGAPVPPAVAQRLALARVLLADPHTLVLDEATSLLDAGTARSLERSVDRVLAGRTVIAIAHRLHTAAAADRVAVVDRGRIVELGAPADLAAADGPYARLLRAAQG
ncbi:ABC transporter ATP-binding protein [Lentzea sp. NPDC042327]|uniref:ABC transporter ATP-binding protein n=1 Tax=Lentzea sp. NPDC042327 TaxID=3154801 RepID=UPI0033DA27FF